MNDIFQIIIPVGMGLNVSLLDEGTKSRTRRLVTVVIGDPRTTLMF